MSDFPATSLDNTNTQQLGSFANSAIGNGGTICAPGTTDGWQAAPQRSWGSRRSNQACDMLGALANEGKGAQQGKKGKGKKGKDGQAFKGRTFEDVEKEELQVVLEKCMEGLAGKEFSTKNFTTSIQRYVKILTNPNSKFHHRSSTVDSATEATQERFENAWLSESVNTLSDFNPLELANCLWSLGKLQECKVSRQKTVLKLKRNDELNLGMGAELFMSDGTEMSRERFLKGWIAAASEKLNSFNIRDLCNSVWALAKLGHCDWGSGGT
jgi:hypothetical protein